MSQIDQIHTHLVNHGSISSWEAISEYRITRVAEYIRQLREMGLDIKSEWKSNIDGKRWVEYILENNHK